MIPETKTLRVKAYSTGELATIYEVDARTFKRWIVPFEELIGERQGRYYNIRQVKAIFEKLCLPGFVILE